MAVSPPGSSRLTEPVGPAMAGLRQQSCRPGLLIPTSITLLAFVLGLPWALWAPPFEKPDEIHHVGMVVHLARTRQLPDPLAVNGPFVRMEAHQPPLYYVGAAAVLVAAETLGAPHLSLDPWVKRHNEEFVGGRPPPDGAPREVGFFEHAEVGWFRDRDFPAGLLVLRLFTLAIACAAAWVTAGLAVDVFAGRPTAAWVTAVVATSVPTRAMLSSAVNNDALTWLFGALALRQALAIARGRSGTRGGDDVAVDGKRARGIWEGRSVDRRRGKGAAGDRTGLNAGASREIGGAGERTGEAGAGAYALLGFTMGLGLLTKLTLVTALPLVLLGIGRMPLRRWATAMAAWFAPILLLWGPWLARNAMLYGDPLGRQERIDPNCCTAWMLERGVMEVLASPIFWRNSWETGLASFGFVNLWLPQGMYRLATIAVALAAAGWAVALVRAAVGRTRAATYPWLRTGSNERATATRDGRLDPGLRAVPVGHRSIPLAAGLGAFASERNGDGPSFAQGTAHSASRDTLQETSQSGTYSASRGTSNRASPGTSRVTPHSTSRGTSRGTPQGTSIGLPHGTSRGPLANAPCDGSHDHARRARVADVGTSTGGPPTHNARSPLPDIRTTIACLAFTGASFAALVAYNMTFNQQQGRYLFHALPAIAILVVAGWSALAQLVDSIRGRSAGAERVRQWAAPAAVVLSVVLALVVNAWGLFGVAVPAYRAEPVTTIENPSRSDVASPDRVDGVASPPRLAPPARRP